MRASLQGVLWGGGEGRRWDASGRREQLTACRYWTFFPGPLPRTSKGRVFVIFPVPRAVDAPRATPHPRVRTACHNVAMSAHASAPGMDVLSVSRFFHQPCGGPIEIG